MKSNLKPHAMPPRKVCEIIHESHSPALQSHSPQAGSSCSVQDPGADFSCILCHPVSSLKNADVSHRLDRSTFIPPDSAIRTFHISIRKHSSSWRRRTLFCEDSITCSCVPIGGHSWYICFIRFVPQRNLWCVYLCLLNCYFCNLDSKSQLLWSKRCVHF